MAVKAESTAGAVVLDGFDSGQRRLHFHSARAAGRVPEAGVLMLRF